MLGELFGSGSQPGQIRGRNGVGKTGNLDDFRRAVRQRAGFVERDDLNLRQPLQRVAFAHQKAVLGGVSDGGHDGGRRGQHQRTRTEYDQNGHGADDLPGEQPCDRGGAQRDDHDPCGPTIRDADDFGLAGVGRLHQALDTASPTVLSTGSDSPVMTA